MPSDTDIRTTIDKLLPEAERFLCKLIGFPSISGSEHELMLALDEDLSRLNVEVERIALSDALRADPDYSDPVPDITYDGRFNLRVARKGRGGGKTLLFNTHTDVVPPSEGMTAPWTARAEDGVVYGRGACDCKGHVATLFLVLKVLDTLNVRLAGDVIAHLVVEEENGGNGTLAMVRRGETADGCVVLESSDGHLYTSIRGAVWFRLTLTGKAGHSGEAGATRSALLMARHAMRILEQYHADLLAESRGFALFDGHPNPMPITFGRLTAGTWPAAAPSEAVLEGVLGILPNKTRDEVCEEMRQALLTNGDAFLAEHFDLRFTYRHDCSVIDPNHGLPQTILGAAEATGTPLELGGMTASCDAWGYNNELEIPTVVYGPGTLAVAHSKDEQIKLSDIARAAEVLTHTILRYCGSGRSPFRKNGASPTS